MEELEYLPFLFVFLFFISQNASQYLISVCCEKESRHSTAALSCFLWEMILFAPSALPGNARRPGPAVTQC